MRLPEITALQFAVLSLLFAGEKTARQLREELRNRARSSTAAAFSQLMRRMQHAAYVSADRASQAVNGRIVSECRYRVTDLGVIVWNSTRAYYNGFDPPPPDLEVVATDEGEFADREPRQRRALVKKKYAKALQRAFWRQMKRRRRGQL